LNDSSEESDETFSVQLRSVAGSVVGPTDSLVVTILDHDGNTAPQVNAGEDRQVNAGQTVRLTATAQDAEGDAISYQWRQISGASVNLQNAATASPSFVAPATTTSLVFRVTATDNRGASSSDEISVTVVTVSLADNGSGGGSTPWLLIMALLLAIWRSKDMNVEA
jgi:hypothetical protein